MSSPAPLTSAIILAAGRGTRMWPYGETKPKAALPVLNRPNIATQVEMLRAMGIQTIVVVVGHLDGAVRHALRHDPDVTYVVQAEPTGTADAVALALPHVRETDVVVLYGDVATTQRGLQDLLQRRGDFAGTSMVLLTPLGRERARDWICAQTSGNRVARIWGHPRGEVESRLAGAFVLTEAIRPYLAAHPEFMTSVQVGTMPPRDRDLAMALQAAIADGVEIGAVETAEPCFDLDKPWHLLEATRALLDVRAGTAQADVVPASSMIHEHADVRGGVVLGENVYIGPRVVIQGNVWIGDGTIVDNGAIIGPNVMIGSACEVRDYCTIEAYTVLGDDCHVGHAAEIAGLFFENVWAVHYMEIWGIVGSSSDLGAATVCGTLRFDDSGSTHRIRGRKELAYAFANASYLGDYTRTGVNAILMPGCKAGPYSIVGPGVVLNEDLPANTLVTVEQTLQRRRWGPERYGW